VTQPRRSKPGSSSGATEHDRAELERFSDYCRRVYQAEQAGVPGEEAARAIYPDVYERPPCSCHCVRCGAAYDGDGMCTRRAKGW
jgi:hypothetical protein